MSDTITVTHARKYTSRTIASREAVAIMAIDGPPGPPGSVVDEYADAPQINQDGATIANYPASINTLYLDGDCCCVSSI